MEKYILDTSVFTNPDVFSQFSPNFPEAIHTFAQLYTLAVEVILSRPEGHHGLHIRVV